MPDAPSPLLGQRIIRSLVIILAAWKPGGRAIERGRKRKRLERELMKAKAWRTEEQTHGTWKWGFANFYYLGPLSPKETCHEYSLPDIPPFTLQLIVCS